MQGNRSVRRVSRRLGVVALLLAAVVSATLYWQSSQAGAGQYTESTYAFASGDQLNVAVQLGIKPGQELSGNLQIDLIDAKGKVVKSANRNIAQKEPAAFHRFEFTMKADQRQDLTVRTIFLAKQNDRPLAAILLAKAHETALVAGKDYFTGSRTALRVQVQAIRSISEAMPLPGSSVTVQLRTKDKVHTLYEGKTDAKGEAVAQFTLPTLPAGNYSLEVTTESALGKETLKNNVMIRDDAKILLITDKPVYQPGQLMHLRALVLRPFDLKPVDNAEIIFEVEDGKGNKVFKKALQTSKFGVAAADFQLADEVNMGSYQIRAFLGSYKADKIVQVKKYVLPKFKVEVTADKKFYLPKETIQGSVQADYFFGKPVANSQIEIVASTFDVEFKQFQTWKGKTDANGHAKFEIKLPDYFVGQPLQKGNALAKLDVKITDTATQKVEVTKSYTVSEQPIQVSLIAEGGKLVPDVKNRVFVAAIYPDGSPAAADVKVWSGQEAKGDPLATVKTNASGLAEIMVTPKEKDFRQGEFKQHKFEVLGGEQFGWGPTILYDLTAHAKDAKGTVAKTTLVLNAHPLGENVLLRLDKAIYQSGDSLKVDIVSSAGLPTAYVDIIRNGQVLLSDWTEVKGGKASYNLDLPQDVFGSIEVHAYQMLASGDIIRDSRVIYVQPTQDLKIQVKADKDVYAPGETGTISFHVTDAKGTPTAAALGLIVVDEAVYALQELHPGLEKVYFTLQEELLKPQVSTKYAPETIDGMVLQQALPPAKQQVAQVLLAGVEIKAPAGWQVNPALERKQFIQNHMQQLGWSMWSGAIQGWHDFKVLRMDKASGKLEFAPDAITNVVKKGWLHAGNLKGPFGEKLDLNDIAKFDKQFTPDNLGKSVTQHRLQNLFNFVAEYTNKNKAKYFKNGAWDLSDPKLLDASVDMKGGTKKFWCIDSWDQPLKIVKKAKKEAHISGQVQFENYDIVSAGPDGKFDTKDDVRWDNSWNGGAWWGGNANLGQLQLQGNMWMQRANMAKGGMPMFMADAAMMPANAGAAPGGLPPQAAPVPTTAAPGPVTGPGASQGGAAPITKVREYFPETMLWQPSLITDANGKADLNINFADSITTWRLTASANSLKGGLGGTTTGLKVFQDFFVDMDLPVNLTQSDEVSFPVAIFNYLSTPQQVKIELQEEKWFELLDGAATRTLDLKANEVTSVSFRIKAKKVGNQPLTVKAYGSKKSDAVKRIVEVVPNGEKIEIVINDRLEGNIAQTITIPQDAVPDSYKMMVKIYPGIMSQVVEGMEGMLQMPGGCFEQTSSSAYPNILVVDYIKKSKLAKPAMLMKAEGYLNTGYQRLLTFERPGGGFDWWGSGEPLIWLSAYGLQEFNDMSKVWPVDKGIIDRTQSFLLNKMGKDGTWSTIGATHGETIERMGDPKLLLTSYVTWSLLESGLAKEKAAQSILWIRNNVGAAGDNAYILALAANALAAYDAKDDSTIQVIQKLEKLRQDKNDWQACFYAAKAPSLTYATGDSVNVETTALTVLAMLKTGQFTNSVNKSLTYLIKAKQGNGAWGSTQSTILALKALIAGLGGAKQAEDAPVSILVDGKEVGATKITQDNADMLHAFDLKDVTKLGNNQVEIKVAGKTSLMYQIVGRYYQPWSDKKDETKPAFDVKVAYDRTKLSTHDMLKAKAMIKYLGKAETNMVMLELGIAPGFTIDAGDFAEMVDKKLVQKFSITPTKVILYMGKVMQPGETRSFDYTLKAKYPVRAQTPPTVAYEYYTPTNLGVSQPVELTVEDKKGKN